MTKMIGTPIVYLDHAQLVELVREHYAQFGATVQEASWNDDNTLLVVLDSIALISPPPTDRAVIEEIHTVDDRPETIGEPAPSAASEPSAVTLQPPEDANVLSSGEGFIVYQGGSPADTSNWVDNKNAPRHKRDTDDKIEKRRQRIQRVRAEQDAEQEALDAGVPHTVIQKKYVRYKQDTKKSS